MSEATKPALSKYRLTISIRRDDGPAMAHRLAGLNCWFIYHDNLQPTVQLETFWYGTADLGAESEKLTNLGLISSAWSSSLVGPLLHE